MSKNILTMTFVMSITILSCSAYAINLGSVQRISSAQTTPLDFARLNMLFWNTENDSYLVKLTAYDYPKDWLVIADPNEFLINRETGEEYISLPYMQDNIKAKVVDIFVRPSKSSPAGTYKITIKSETSLPRTGNSGMSLMTERMYDFTVNLTGAANPNTTESKETITYYTSLNKTQDSAESRPDYKMELYIAIVFLVVLISIIIYKKYK